MLTAFSEVVRRAYEGRMEVDSASASELEDVHMSDEDSSSSSDGTLSHITRRTLINGYGHDRYDAMGTKRKFFRSSLVWDPLQRHLRNKIAATIDRNCADPMFNGWSN